MLSNSCSIGTSDLFAQWTIYKDIYDGESKTIVMGDTPQEHAWALPKTAGQTPPSRDGEFGSRHTGGAQFVFCDVSVQFIREDIDPEIFEGLCALAGAESVGEP